MRRPTTDRIFIPEFCGNRDLPESEQVTVELNIATIKERDVFSKMLFKKGGKVAYYRGLLAEHRQEYALASEYYFESALDPAAPPEVLARALHCRALSGGGPCPDCTGSGPIPE